MNLLKTTISALFLSFTFLTFAQDAELLSKVPENKAEFIESEPNLLATIEWLETTPVTEQDAKRKEQYGLLLTWLSKSPTVTVSVYDKATPFLKKNPELLFMFMAGYAKYALANDYAKDAVKGSTEGIRSSIKLYQLGGMKKDKYMKKLIELEANGKLESWVAKELSSK